MNATVLSLVLATLFAPPAKTSAERSTRIYVRTTPPGASIILDGKELGTSDGLFLVPPGVRKITLEMDGYDPEGKTLDVKEGWITRVEVRMVKKGGKPDEAAGAGAIPSTPVDSVETPEAQLNARWGLLSVESDSADGDLLTTGQLTAALTHLEEPDVHKVLLKGQPEMTKGEFQKALAKGYELTHHYGMWALITSGIGEPTKASAFPPSGVQYAQWEVADDGAMRFRNRPATIDVIRADLASRDRETANRTVLLLEFPAGSLFEDHQKYIDQAFEWQNKFGLAGVGLGIQSATRPGRLDERRVVQWKVRGDGTEMELIARVKKNYGAYARETWKATLDEIPEILASLPDRRRRVLEIGFTEEVPDNVCKELTLQAAAFVQECGFWYGCNLGSGPLLPNLKSAQTPHVVRWVIQDEDTMTLEGEPVTSSQIPTLLRTVPNRHRTILEVGYDRNISVKMRDEYVGRASALAQQFGFKYASDVGQQMLGSTGLAARQGNDSARETTSSPAAVVEEFLEAVRVGDDEKATSLFTPTARAQVAKVGCQVAPKGSATATFDVVKVTSTDDHASVVATWTDFGRTDRMTWLVRSGSSGWRITGMETTVFPGEPPVVLDFENLEEGMRKMRELRETIEAGSQLPITTAPVDAALLRQIEDHIKGLEFEVASIDAFVQKTVRQLETAATDDKSALTAKVWRLNPQSAELEKQKTEWEHERALLLAGGEGPKSLPAVYFDRTINDFDEGQGQEAIDLDTGKLYDLPVEIGKWEASQRGKWFEEYGIDLVGEHAEDKWGLGGPPLAVTLVPADDVKLHEADKRVADVLKEKDERQEGRILTDGDIEFLSVPKDRDPPLNFAFRTAKGTEGFLQIVELNEEEPKSMRLRWKVTTKDNRRAEPGTEEVYWATERKIEAAFERLGALKSQLESAHQTYGPQHREIRELERNINATVDTALVQCDLGLLELKREYTTTSARDRKAKISVRMWMREQARNRLATFSRDLQIERDFDFDRVVCAVSNGMNRFAFDLDEGKSVNAASASISVGDGDFAAPAGEIWATDRGKGWLMWQGTELLVAHVEDTWGLIQGIPGFLLVPADDVSPESAQARVRTVLQEKDKRLDGLDFEDGDAILLPPLHGSAEGLLQKKPPFRYAFRTTRGAEGLLQIDPDTTEPVSLRLRWKLTKEPHAPNNDELSDDAPVRKINLPDADTKDTPVVLDLASGEMLNLPKEQNDATYFTKLGKGDIGFDEMLFCLRGGKVELLEDGVVKSLDVNGMKDDAKVYQLPKFPCQLLVTTPEKRQFTVRVLNETAEGTLSIEYQEKEQADVESEVTDVTTPHVTTPAPEDFDTKTRAKIQDAKVQMTMMAAAMERYRLDTGEPLPAGFDALLRCTDDVARPERWNGPYLKAPNGTVPLDPWGNEYKVLGVGEGKQVHRGVWSYGPDGKPNTPDDLDTTERAHTLDLLRSGVLEFRIAANVKEAEEFEKTGKDLSWFDSLTDETSQCVTRRQGRRSQLLLWETPEKSMTASGDGKQKWQIIQVSVIAEPDKPGRIGVVFDQEGGRQLQELTADNINRRLAMLIDGRVVCCPTVRAAIGPRVEITGNFSKAELTRMATALQAGMEPNRPEVPAPVQ